MSWNGWKRELIDLAIYVAILTVWYVGWYLFVGGSPAVYAWVVPAGLIGVLVGEIRDARQLRKERNAVCSTLLNVARGKRTLHVTRDETDHITVTVSTVKRGAA